MKRGGFSLAEVMVALLLLSTLGVVMVGVIPATVRGTRATAHRAVAAWLANGVLEQVRGQPLNTLASGPWGIYELDAVSYEVALTAAAGVGSVPAQNPPANPYSKPPVMIAVDPAAARLVTVTVTWQDRPGVKSQHRVRKTLYRTR